MVKVISWIPKNVFKKLLHNIRFLAECCKRQLNPGSFVLLYFRLSTFFDLYWVCLSVFSCTVLSVSISQVIGCEDRLRNDLYCVEWGVKLYPNQPKLPCRGEHTAEYSGKRVCMSVSVSLDTQNVCAWIWPQLGRTSCRVQLIVLINNTAIRLSVCLSVPRPMPVPQNCAF